MTLMQGIALLDFARKVIAGEMKDPKDIAKGLIGLALDIAPVDELMQHLTAESRSRDDAIVDALEAAKVGS